MNTAIAVLGMHRSGTSALTGLLSILGAAPGEHLLPPAKDFNPKGYWEHSDVVFENEKILESVGFSWRDARIIPDRLWDSDVALRSSEHLLEILKRDFSSEKIWILKDPRLSRLMPLWDSLFKNLDCQTRFVICLRHPLEVAHSLYVRDGFPIEKSCLLWLRYTLEAELATRSSTRAFIVYDDLLADWRKVISDISPILGDSFDVNNFDRQKAADEFIDPALRHHADSTTPEFSGVFYKMACKCFQLMSSNHADLTVCFNDLDLILQECNELTRQISPWEEVVEKQKLLLDALQAENSKLDAELRHLKDHLIIGRFIKFWGRFINRSIQGN